MPYKKPPTLKQKLSNLGASILVALVALLPLWFWLAARWLMAPEGFWQNLLLFGVGLWFLGFVQLLLIVLAAILIFHFWE